MKMKGIGAYHEYVNKAGDRYDVFVGVVEQFSIKKAIYPGSYIHITPSLIIPEVIYVDTDKKAIKFFENEKEIINFVNNNKVYTESSIVKFQAKDYWSEISIPYGYADLLISQYAGFVSQACKKYLKKGGILLVNDSHGDATMARVDEDYNFIGVLKYANGEFFVENKELEKYFIIRGGRGIDIDVVKNSMKGPKYKTVSGYYIFKKITG